MPKLSKLYDRVVDLHVKTALGYNRPSIANSFISIKKYDPLLAILPNKITVNEGTEIRFDVNSLNVKDGSTVYYVISGCSASDFVDGSLTGSCVINNGSGFFTKTLAADLTTEGVESFRVGLKTSASGKVIKYSELIGIGDVSLAPVYAVTATPESTNESGSVTFNWSVTNSVGATLTWELTGVSAADFTDGLGLSGSLTGTSGSVTKVLAADMTVEGLETALFVLKANGSAVATCTCTISDTSVAETVNKVFKTTIYTDNGTTQTINTNIDLANKGGLVWLKPRNANAEHALQNTTIGMDYVLRTNSNTAQDAWSGVTAISSTGLSLNFEPIYASRYNNVFWTFRKAPKFFDVVTYTGNGAASRGITHSLGITPGMVVVKKINTTGAWNVRGPGFSFAEFMFLNAPTAKTSEVYLGNGAWGSSTASNDASNFYVGWSSGLSFDTNTNGATYVAYLFAHDTSPTGLIQCGSFNTVGTSNPNATIVLGFRPQYVLYKSSSTTSNWKIVDTARGLTESTNSKVINANTSGIEYTDGSGIFINANGFTADTGNTGQTYIYMAIREA